MAPPSQKIKDKCDDLKKKLSEFHPAKSASKPEGYPYVINWEARTSYCVFKKTYTESADGVNVGTVKEIFKVVHSRYSLKNKEYITGDVLCGDSVVNDGVCFNVLKEPISEWTNEYHYEYLFNKDLILINTSDFYKGYILKQDETEAAAKAGGAENAEAKVSVLEEQLQSKKEDSDNMKEEFKEMSGYIAELEKWINDVRKETAKLPNRLFQKLNPQQGGDAAGPSGKGKGKGIFGGVFGGKNK
tara:strand:+ start:1234 stop:1965 length:732 start_codon:yes stop_codon:yes gene_type:complete